MLNNCFRFAPRDSVPGLIAKICKYLKDHPGWSEEELEEHIKQFIEQTGVESFNGRTGAVVLNEDDVNNLKIASAYFAEGDETIDELDIASLYNQGVRFVFTDWNSVTSGYNLSFVLDYFSGSDDVVYYPMATGSSGGSNIVSVNGKTGIVELSLSDILGDSGAQVKLCTAMEFTATTLATWNTYYENGYRLVCVLNNESTAVDFMYVLKQDTNNHQPIMISSGTSESAVISVNTMVGAVTVPVVDVSNEDSQNPFAKIFINESEDYPTTPTYTLPIASQAILGGVKAIPKTEEMTQEIGVDGEGKLWGTPYTLPIASQTVLGGVKPVSKTEEMTQEIGVDGEGKLWGASVNGAKYGKLVVFGDSIGQGYGNNDYSFVDIIRESGEFETVIKACKGGATVGPYSYETSADGYSLVEQIERYSSDVADADIVMCEYEGNDYWSVAANKVTMGMPTDTVSATTVAGYARKALERIKELNPNARLMWLPITRNNPGWLYDKFADDPKRADGYRLFEQSVLQIAEGCGCSIVPIYEAMNESLILEDGIHPSTAGQRVIAQTVLANMLTVSDFVTVQRRYTLTSSSASTNAIDGDFNMAYQLIQAGADVSVNSVGSGAPGIFRPAYISSSVMTFSALRTNTAGNALSVLILFWTPSGTRVDTYSPT